MPIVKLFDQKFGSQYEHVLSFESPQVLCVGNVDDSGGHHDEESLAQDVVDIIATLHTREDYVQTIHQTISQSCTISLTPNKVAFVNFQPSPPFTFTKDAISCIL